MNFNIYEIMDKFAKATTDEARIHVLRTYESKALKDWLYLMFVEDIKFYTTIYPLSYKPDTDAPIGMGHSHLGVELRKMYLFVVDHPASKHLSFQKRENLLQRILESLEPREAEMVMAMFRKTPPHPALTSQLVKQAFPRL